MRKSCTYSGSAAIASASFAENLVPAGPVSVRVNGPPTGRAASLTTELAVVQQLHWVHAMWGLPLVVGGVVAVANPGHYA